MSKAWYHNVLRRLSRHQLAIAILIAILLHLAFYRLIRSWLQQPPHHEKPLRVHYVTLPPKTPQLPRPQTPETHNKQIVKIAPPKEQKRPDKADYLSEFDSSVKRQTQSAHINPHASHVAPRLSATQPTDKHAAEIERENAKQVELNKRGLKSPQKINLFPPGIATAPMDASAFPDHVDEVAQDAETALNTWQWKYASFFNRIKDAVVREWAPLAQMRIHDPEGKQFGRVDRVTIVSVTVDRQGHITDVRVQKSSGVPYLDDEGVRAFRAVANFLNPPKALFGSDDTFSFDFGFHVSFSGGSFFNFD